MNDKNRYRFSDTFGKFGIISRDIEIFAKSEGKITVDVKGILLSNSEYKNGAVKILKGSNCHVQHMKLSNLDAKNIKCSDKLRQLLVHRVNTEYSFNIVLEEDIIIYSLYIATNFIYGTEKSEWSDKLIVRDTNRKLGEYFVCKYTLPTEENLKRLRRFWSCGEAVKEAEHSITSDTSSEAEALSEKALKQVSDMIDDRLNEKNNDLEYNYIESKTYINKTLGFNNIKLHKALETLNSTHLLYITGKSGSGKTFLTKEIAGKLCNIDLTNVNINNETFECYNNCLWIETEKIDTNEFRRLLVKFCIHNKNSENCLIVFNEASKPAFNKIFPLWDRVDEGGISFKERLSTGLDFDYNDTKVFLPESLKMISVIADDQYDSQMKRRFKTRLDLNEFSEAEYEEISIYTGIEREIIDILFEFQVLRCEQAYNEKHRMERAFIVPYELKTDRINTLEEYLSKHLKAVGPDWEEKRNIVKNYIEELKKNEI